jgi:hypothetical protein
MISASPRPVKPRPMRRLAAASLLLRQRPVGGVEHVVEHARRQFDERPKPA